jgi:hypothetical protein
MLLLSAKRQKAYWLTVAITGKENDCTGGKFKVYITDMKAASTLLQ